MSWPLGTWEGEGNTPSWLDLEDSLVARPSWAPDEQKGLKRPLHLESTVVGGSARSEVEDHCGLRLEEKAREISGNLMEKRECLCSDWSAV